MKLRNYRKKLLDAHPEIELDLKKDLAYQIGNIIMQARLLKGVTQEKLANKMGTRQPSIARVENGSVLPSLRFLDKMAKAFNTYVIPPKFAFMDQATGGIVDDKSNSAAEKLSRTKLTPSPFVGAVEIKSYAEDQRSRL